MVEAAFTGFVCCDVLVLLCNIGRCSGLSMAVRAIHDCLPYNNRGRESIVGEKND